jgi:flagellar biosynthesis regulator FlbT
LNIFRDQRLIQDGMAISSLVERKQIFELQEAIVLTYNRNKLLERTNGLLNSQ